MLRASQSMVRLVMNLLDVARSEDGALVPHVTEFDLSTAARRGLQGDGAAGRGQGPAARRSPFAPELGPLRADRDLIRRMLENLIDNAYKYGPRHATIASRSLPATMDDGAEPAVEIRVRDEGEGIPAAYRQRSSRSTGGSTAGRAHAARNSHGLGLVFCRRAVGVHGGAIWVEDGGGPRQLLLRPAAASRGCRCRGGPGRSAPAAAPSALAAG